MTDVQLDPSQLDAVEVEPDTRQLVIAGPGSGKTQVVSNLVAHLVDEEGVDPTDGILVLSFSNAAVHAADARLRASGGAPVTVQTMDSLAGEIIRDLSDEDVAGLGFDRRIRLATTLLAGEPWDRLDGLEHLVVDEIQDVVGVRADFLLQILAALPDDAGFSLLGDPAQGIYDWQLRPENSPLSATTSLELLATVRRMAGVSVKELTGQYRARSRDARKVVAMREAALRGDGNSSLDDFYAGLVPVGDIASAVEHARRWSGNTVFLTPNNGQALLTAEAIAATGDAVEVRRSAHQRVLAQWIARILADHPMTGITRDEVDKRACEVAPDLDPASIWRALRSVTGGAGREVNLPVLARGLRRPRPLVPDLIEPMNARFVVSTVHRAKGLEFDNVVRLDFPDKPWLDVDGPDDAESVRAMFVALSRARDVIVRGDGPDDRRLRASAGRSGRWYLSGWKPGTKLGYQFKVDDLDRAEPPGVDKVATQIHIAQDVRPGDPLRFELDLTRSTLALPFWNLLHDGYVVGRSSLEFGEGFARWLGPRDRAKVPWPRITGARVESIATVSGETQRGAVGRHGLWLSPVCSGMLRFDWSGDRDD
ncbi:MAG: AAA family ATPase [Promicromonosporaceae bacterium]|nr:AAA family ATPase [Promicromonosporaceae bacterium]